MPDVSAPRSLGVKYTYGQTEVIEYKAAEGDEPAVGRLRAVFSTFDKPDREGDIIRQSALTDGQEIPLVWHHMWQRPVGKGIIEVQKKRAIFDGNFFMDTADGLEAFKTVKNMGSLQQYSWGFQILEAEPIKDEEDDEEDSIWWWGPLDITKTEAFEVSPVLVGANQYTQTLMVKDGTTRMYVPRDSKSPDGRRMIHKSWLGFEAPSKVDDSKQLESIIEETTTTTTVEIETVIEVDIDGPIETVGKTLADDFSETLTSLRELTSRFEVIKAFRAEKGRNLSEPNAERLTEQRSALSELIDVIDVLLVPIESESVTVAERDFRADRAKINHRRRQLLASGD